MAYKYSNPTFFVNKKDITSYSCYTQYTNYGFRHIAFKGVVTNPYSKKPDARRSYYNSTCESWEYESVLSELTDPNDLIQATLEVR